MILEPGSEIDLERLARALRAALIELQYVEHAPDTTILDARYDEAREGGIRDFARYVYDHSEHEVTLRNGLAYVLNLDGDDFPPVAERLAAPFIGPYQPHIRRLLEQLWERTWSDWRIELFDPGDFELRGS